MKSLEFDKEQYKRLMELVYMGSWLVNAHRTEDRKTEYDEIVSYVFSQAIGSELENFVDPEPIGSRFFPNRDFEEETCVEELISDYDNETFWEELVERLAERDMFSNNHALNDDEVISKQMFEYSEKYNNEFENHGLDRLAIKE